MDVKAAYLNGNLEEEIYMKQAEGFEHPGQEEKVYQLHKSIYGLKQAGRLWYQKIDTYLESLGMKRLNADNCVYIRQNDGNVLVIALYVDDLLIFTNRIKELEELKKHLKERFDMKDLGDTHYCLGIQILRDRSKKQVRINQSKYIEDILSRFEMQDCNPISTPMDPGAKLSSKMSPRDDNQNEMEKMKAVPYQNAIRSLMYAMLGSRPDIAFAVGAVSRYLSNPGEGHWKAIKRILRYLKGTITYELTYGEAATLQGYTDADWAGAIDD